MREFDTAMGRAIAENPDGITFKLGEREITAKPPTVGQLSLFLNGGRGGGLRSIESMIVFLGDLVSDADWRYIENLLRDGLDVRIVSEITNYLVGEWTGRPLSQSPASTLTQSGTGRKSTAKRRVAASTSSRSRSTVS